jgi:hypothetical protein
LVVQRLWQTDVEIRRENRADESTHDEFCEMAVAAAELLGGGNEVEQDLLAIGLRLEEMLNRERKILAKPGGITNEPRLARKPTHPFGCLDLLGRYRRSNDPLGVVAPRHAFDALVRERDAG